MIVRIYAKTHLTNKEGETDREPRIGQFNYGDIEAGSFRNLINHLIDSVNTFVCKAEQFNKARILDTTFTIRGYRVVFSRDDGTTTDEVIISNETIDEVNDLLLAFTTV